MNRDHLLYEAKQEVLALAADGYAPPVRERNCYAAGRDARAALRAAIYIMQQGGYTSEYDAYISGQLAHVLCGGDAVQRAMGGRAVLPRPRARSLRRARRAAEDDRAHSTHAETGKPLRN